MATRTPSPALPSDRDGLPAVLAAYLALPEYDGAISDSDGPRARYAPTLATAIVAWCDRGAHSNTIHRAIDSEIHDAHFPAGTRRATVHRYARAVTAEWFAREVATGAPALRVEILTSHRYGAILVHGIARAYLAEHPEAGPPAPAPVLYALPIACDNDANGNPRRGWIMHSAGPAGLTSCGYVDEGYGNALHELRAAGRDVRELGTIPTTPAYRREWMASKRYDHAAGLTGVDRLENDPAHRVPGPWRPDSSGPNWVALNVETGETVKAGPPGAKRTNYYDKAIGLCNRKNAAILARTGGK